MSSNLRHQITPKGFNIVLKELQFCLGHKSSRATKALSPSPCLSEHGFASWATLAVVMGV